nr:DUF2497 domain-containing protein [Methylobacterium oryzihabitans]
MSAASPKQDLSPDKANEPSMEEILASIRRIIADDQKPAEVQEAPRKPRPVPDPDDVLDLADVAPPPAPERIPPLDFDMAEVAFKDEPIDFDSLEVEPDPLPPPPPPKAPEPPPEPPRVAVAPPPPPADERLLSNAADASVSQAFHLLANTVLSNNARTLEDLVQDMLRPMLKAWLDDNLPVMVERLVRAEIERVARGR